jgi:hypothetical protein
VKRAFSAAFFFLVVLYCWGQDILHQKEKVPGIYFSFEEYKNNAPSQQGHLLIKEIANPHAKYPVYQLFKKDEKGKEREFRKQYWGFSDGKNVYVHNPKTGRNCKILLIGTLNLFADFQLKMVKRGGRSYQNSPGLTQVVAGNDYYVLSASTGEISEITPHFLHKLFSSDPSMEELLRHDHHKKENYEEYIRKYNELMDKKK